MSHLRYHHPSALAIAAADPANRKTQTVVIACADGNSYLTPRR